MLVLVGEKRSITKTRKPEEIEVRELIEENILS
jgi:hypothetical protein